MELIAKLQVNVIYSENGSSLNLGCFIANILDLTDFH